MQSATGTANSKKKLATKASLKEVTLFFRSRKAAEEFAIGATLCMLGGDEFNPADLLNATAKFTAIRLGNPAN